MASDSTPPSDQALRIFLSYAAPQKRVAEDIFYALRVCGHDVFFDRESLPAGEEYHQRIVDGITSSDLFIFLVSDDSLRAGSYARSELSIASRTWPNPHGHVLAVKVGSVEFSEIPPYLLATNILRPEGNVALETVEAINSPPGQSIRERINQLFHAIHLKQARKPKPPGQARQIALQEKYGVLFGYLKDTQPPQSALHAFSAVFLLGIFVGGLILLNDAADVKAAGWAVVIGIAGGILGAVILFAVADFFHMEYSEWNKRKTRRRKNRVRPRRG